ncbi:MAG: hypothetical protein J7M40_12645 [Planctomycetes bacterium]|nr:hypothetical protein [Planctomycetota bacterium]
MNKVLMAVMVICLGLAGIASAAIPLANDLVGYWSLDGNGNDASVNGNDGVLQGDPVLGSGEPNAVKGQAYRFDGSNYIEIANNATFDITDQITMSVWIQVDLFDTGWQSCFSRGDWSWRMARNGDSNLSMDMSAAAGGNMGAWGPVTTSAVGSTAGPTSEWYHIVGVWPGTGQPASIYVNGSHENDTVPLNGSIATRALPADPVVIGGQIHDGNVRRLWKGAIDEVAIWDRALSAEDVNSLYNSGDAMTIVDWRASGPSPADDENSDPRIIVEPSLTVSWTPGAGASPALVSQSLYGGTNPDALDFMGEVSAATTSAIIPGLTQDAIYYWRVDGHNSANTADPNTTATGLVWAFNADMRVDFTTQPQNQAGIAGDTVQFSVRAISDTPITGYQWFGPGGLIPGETADTLTIVNIAPADAGAYFCAVTNAFGAKESNSAQLVLLELLGHWPLDGNADDISGNNNTGVVLNGTASWEPTGVIGGAANFTNNWLLQIPNPAHFDQANTGITVYCWIKSGGIGNWNPFVSKYGESGQGWQLRKRSGDDRPVFTLRGMGNDDPDNSYNGLFNNEWHQVVGSWDGAIRRLFVDGVEIHSTPNSGSINFTDQAVAIGGRMTGGNPGNYFNGQIDDVRIYKGGMNANTVAALYTEATGLAVCPAPPAADISGPAGVPDCIVDFWDLIPAVDAWLGCNRIPVSECP